MHFLKTLPSSLKEIETKVPEDGHLLFLPFYQSQKLNIFFIEDLLKNFNWLKNQAKTISEKHFFFILSSTYQSFWSAKQSSDLLDYLKLNRNQFVFLCNTQLEVLHFTKANLKTELVNYNSWLDESIYSINEHPKQFSAVINAQTSFQKFYLSKNIVNLAGAVHEESLTRMAGLAHCGLVLNKGNGSCIDVSRFLLSGIPVVSLKSIKGSRFWFDDYNSFLCEDSPESIENAVNYFIKNPREPKRIRETHIALAKNQRVKFSQLVQELFDKYDICEDAKRYLSERHPINVFKKTKLDLSQPILDSTHQISFSVDTNQKSATVTKNYCDAQFTEEVSLDAFYRSPSFNVFLLENINRHFAWLREYKQYVTSKVFFIVSENFPISARKAREISDCFKELGLAKTNFLFLCGGTTDLLQMEAMGFSGVVFSLYYCPRLKLSPPSEDIRKYPLAIGTEGSVDELLEKKLKLRIMDYKSPEQLFPVDVSCGVVLTRNQGNYSTVFRFLSLGIPVVVSNDVICFSDWLDEYNSYVCDENFKSIEIVLDYVNKNPSDKNLIRKRFVEKTECLTEAFTTKLQSIFDEAHVKIDAKEYFKCKAENPLIRHLKPDFHTLFGIRPKKIKNNAEIIDYLDAELSGAEIRSFPGSFTQVLVQSRKFSKLYLVDADNRVVNESRTENCQDGVHQVKVNGSLDFFNSLPESSLDFVFLDSSNDVPVLKKELWSAFRILKKNGVLAGSDYNPDLFPEVVQAVNEFAEECGLNPLLTTEKRSRGFVFFKGEIT